MNLKDNNFYKKYLEYSSNPQTKAIIYLCFWLLFFVFIIIFVRSTNKNVKKNNEFVNDRINSYEYTYKDDRSVIFGKTFAGKHLFNVSNHKYYYDGSYIYEIEDYNLNKVFNINVDYLKITPQMINDLTLNLKYSIDNGFFVYNVPLSNFLNLFSLDVPVNLEDAGKYNIIIEKKYLGGKLSVVKLDLSNYYNYFKIDNRGILTIDYYEQNKVNNFTSEYDGMIGVIK